MSTRTWQDNAAEFGALTKQGVDVRLAALIACSVKKGTRGGVNPRSGIDKATIVAFATQAGTGQDRIKRHLEAWDKCAHQGRCKPSADLTPDDVNTTEVPTQEQFASVFDATGSGSRPRDSKPEHAVQIIEKRGAEEVIEQMTPETFAKVSDAVVKRTQFERDVETISRGGTPPNREALTSPDPSYLDILGDTAKARVDAEAALRAVLPALRAVGGITDGSPLGDLVRTTAMEMTDLLIATDVPR